MTFTTRQTIFLGATEMSNHTPFASIFSRSILTSQTNCVLDWPSCQRLQQLVAIHSFHRHICRSFNTQSSMAVTIIEARNTFTIVHRIANIKWFTLLTLTANGIIMAFQANVQLIGTLTIRMAIALTHNAAVCADISEITFTEDMRKNRRN